MTAPDIRYHLDLKGVTQQSLATTLEVSAAMISMIINGERKTPRLRLGVAVAIGRSYEEVWGEAAPNGVKNFTQEPTPRSARSERAA